MIVNIKAVVRKALDALKTRPLKKYTVPSNNKITTVAGSAGMTNTITNSAWTISPVKLIGYPRGQMLSTSNLAQSSYASTYNPTSTIVLYGNLDKELVRLNKDGSVEWGKDVTIDDAAESFAQSLHLGAELSAGITYAVKQQMRDAVFSELINMANDKGSLTVDDLTYLHQAAKIMDKLRGIKE